MGIVKLFEKYCGAGDMQYLATTATTTNSDTTPSQQLDAMKGRGLRS
jgi:hypothetical protein